MRTAATKASAREMQMFEEQGQGASPESSPGTDVLPQQTDPSSAGTQNTEQPGQVVTDARGNVIPPWRVNEMVQHASERTAAQLRQEFAAERQQMQAFYDRQSQAAQQTLLQGLQQRAAQPSRTPEEEAQRRQATEMLHDLAPGLKAMPALAQATLQAREQQAQLAQRLGQLEATQARTFAIGEQGRLAQMAQAHGLASNGQQFAALENYVAGIIRSDPRAHAAFEAGDPNVLPWALAHAKTDIDAQRQAARASVASTKTNLTRTVPPRIGGSQPGATPIPRFDPKNPRGSMAAIHAGAEADLMARLGG